MNDKKKERYKFLPRESAKPDQGHDLEINVSEDSQIDSLIADLSKPGKYSAFESVPVRPPGALIVPDFEKPQYVYCQQWFPGVELRDFKHYGADQDQAKWTPAWDEKCWFGGNNLVLPGQYCLILTDGGHVVARTEAELNEFYEKV